jgi:hypothetical protein
MNTNQSQPQPDAGAGLTAQQPCRELVEKVKGADCPEVAELWVRAFMADTISATNKVCAKMLAAAPAPHAAQAEALREKYYLLENADGVTPQILHAFATPQERDVATIGLIFGEEISTQDEAEQWDKYRQELIDTGRIEFEGDPGLEWFSALTPTGHDGGMGDTTDGAKEANEFGQWSKEAQLVRQEKLTSALWGFAHDIQHYPHNAKSADGTSVNLEAVACAQEIILGIFHQKKISIQ